MPGIYGFFSKNLTYEVSEIYRHFYNFHLEAVTNEEFRFQDLIYGRSVINKFTEDRIVYENQQFIILFEGVCYNIQKGKIIDYFIDNFTDNNLQFLEKLKGVFCGFILKKNTQELYIFTDPLSTKPIYYYESNDFFLFASEVKVVSKLIRNIGIRIQENLDAWRCLLSFGYLLGDLTPVKNVKKLRYGSYLKLNLNTLSRQLINYFEFPSKSSPHINERGLIGQLKNTIDQAVTYEWEKDKEYGYSHFSFLSGGLDSRLNVLLANRYGFKEINTITFSESGSMDEKIADLISSQYGFNHRFIPLDGGTYLQKNLEEYVKANDGIVILHGAAHLQSSISNLDLNNFGLGHSGQIGDVIFGSYFLDGSIHSNLKKACYNFDLEIINKIDCYNELRANDYNGDDTELFLYKNRAINGILNGDRVAQCYFDTSSPFYDIDVIRLGLQIPPNLKKNSRFYRQLISNKYPFLSEHKWQQTGIRPKKGYTNEWISYLTRLKRYIERKCGLVADNMNPFNFWYSKNELVKKNIETTFNKNLYLIEDSDLRNDVLKTFNTESVSNKLSATTVLLSKKMHFID